MQVSKAELVERERRWSMPVALATLAGVALLVGSVIAIGDVKGDGSAEVLRLVHEHGSSVTLSTVLEIAGFILLVAPLVYLFRATEARGDRVRAQFIGVVVAAPIFLAVAAGLNAVATTSAASDFVDGKVKPTLSQKEALADCRSDRSDSDAKAFNAEYDEGPAGTTAVQRCTEQKIDDDTAEDAASGFVTRDIATGFGLAGRLGLAFALFYSCLWAMRVGLLTRFWGSLGVALGVAALLLLIQFTLIWFLYFGLLLAGWVPGGRPPAWAAGEAIPWPTPGEKAAGDLSPPPEDPQNPTEKGQSQ